jgi:ATP/maltotriose-dependent transcriptional regulator MalT
VEALLEAVEEALAARVIEELPQSVGRYQFSHVLIQNTLAQRLSMVRRARLHQRIAETLEEQYGSEVESHVPELVYHFAQAAPVLGTEKLVRYSGLAGEQALSTYAWEEALAHFERGLATMGSNLKDTAAARDADEAALLFGMGRAQSAILREDQLLETFAIMKRAFGYYAEAGNIAMAVAIAEFPINPTGRFPGNAELMVRALALVPSDSYEAGRLLSRYGGILGLAQSDYEGAQQALGRALAIARREGDLALEVQTLTYASDVSGQHIQWQESVNYGLRSIAQSAGHESSYSAVLSRWWTSVSLLHIGDLERARTHTLDLRDLAEKQSTPRYYSMLGLVPIVTLSCLEGNWTAGREYCDHILKGALTHRQILCARILLEYETGEFDQGKIYVERLLEEMRRGLTPFALGKAPMTLIEVARITDVVDHLDIAESTAEALLSEPTIPPIVAMYAKAGLALLAVHTDNQSEAAEHYAYFREHRGTMIWTLASADRLLGLLAQTVGDLEQAAAHFEDALAFCRKAGYWPELAWTCHDYAEALLHRNGPGDQAHAISFLEEGLTTSRELGMRPLTERVVAMQERGKSLPGKAPAYPNGLTQREVEVLRLVAAGKSSTEIAAELVLSRRTVERHISNIYSKTNTHNRSEATAFAFIHGLMSST